MKKSKLLQTLASEQETATQPINSLLGHDLNALALDGAGMASAASISSDTLETVDDDTTPPPGTPRSGPRPTGCPLGLGRNCRLPTGASCPRKRNPSAPCTFQR